MFMIITMLFLVLYLPRMITSILESKSASLWETLTVEQYAVVGMLEILYILNYVANPFVYAFMDFKFKTELKRMFSCKI